jgi:hypothetical protein
MTTQDPGWIQFTVTNVIIPIFLGVLAFFGSNTMNSLQTRRRNSNMAAALIAEFHEEVAMAIQIMKSYAPDSKDEKYRRAKLPNKTWEGMKSLSDEYLERIISVGEGVQPEGFAFDQIRSHLKNHFEYITVNYEGILEKHKETINWLYELHVELKDSELLSGAKKLLITLEQTHRLLKQNSKTLFFPK